MIPTRLARFFGLFATLCCAPLIATPVYASPSFQGLGSPGSTSIGYGVSADGSVVTGVVGSHAYRWTADTGMVSLGDLGGGTLYSEGFGISADGSTITGLSGIDTLGNTQAFRWTSDTGMVALPNIGSTRTDRGLAISADGLAIAGITEEVTPFRWTSSGGSSSLPSNAGPNVLLRTADAISADGSVIAGHGLNLTTFDICAYYWQEGVGAVQIIDFAGGDGYTDVRGMSDDGLVVVGQSLPGSSGTAFRWTSAGGMEDLGSMPAGGKAWGMDANYDGSVIVGVGFIPGGDTETFIWDQTHGIRLLRTVLAQDFGVDVGDWTLDYVYDISPNGRFIVGSGTNPSGHKQAWLVQLPEPSALVLLLLGSVVIAGRRTTT